MFLRPILAALLVISAVQPVLAQAAKKPVVTAVVPTPDDRARQWLVLVDDKNYAQSWSTASKSFQGKQKTDAWAKTEAGVREPMGAVASRTLKSIDLSRNNTAVIKYDTVFARKAAAVETVTLTFESDAWSVADYAIS